MGCGFVAVVPAGAGRQRHDPARAAPPRHPPDRHRHRRRRPASPSEPRHRRRGRRPHRLTPQSPAGILRTVPMLTRAGRTFQVRAELPIAVPMSSRRLKIAVKDHRSTAMPFDPLCAPPATNSWSTATADVLLIDLDPPYLQYKALLDRYGDKGSKIILYPHGGGGPKLSYDVLWEPDARVFANLVTGRRPGRVPAPHRLPRPRAHDRLDLLRDRAVPRLRRRPARRLRPDAPERRRLAHRLSARPQLRGLREARRDARSGSPSATSARSSRTGSGRRRA